MKKANRRNPPRWRLGVDVGGTFTDFVLIDELSGELVREKCLTTPDDPVLGIMNGVNKLCAAGIMAATDLKGIAHATTLVTNVLIERKGAPTGLLSTQGFRDVLELGTDMRYDMYDLDIEFPSPLVPRARRLDVRERMSAEGDCVIAPDLKQVDRCVRQLIKGGVTSIAVCFLHSYRNPAHERAVERYIRREFPDVDISISSLVAPEIREYERTVTVAANAYVKPIVRSYLQRLKGAFADVGADAPILVMLSNGGMTTLTTAAEVPIRLIESGPAAGVLSACHAGERIDVSDLIAFDMGGTTAKVCFVDKGHPAFTGTFEAARVKRQFRGSGLPLKVPSLEMIEIGAGGGSIAKVGGTGLLKVGPESAGAQPGPVCYALGGEHPTVTDADLVLGYLDPHFFLGGDMKLDAAAARKSIAALGKRCKLDATKTAAGIAQIVNQNMATAVRIHAAERGKDYRKYAMFAFGGAGPVHAYEVARILGLSKVICPIGAGTNSAFGLLAAPVAVDLSRSYNIDIAKADWNHLNRLFREMDEEARAILRDAGVRDPVMSRSADMHFLGQGFELTAAAPLGRLGPQSIAAIKRAFHDEYKKIYGALPGDLPVEALTWRLRAAGPKPKVAVAAQATTGKNRRRALRRAYFPEARRYLETAVYNRYALTPGDSIKGPAVVEERESTVVIGPSGRAKVDGDLNLVIRITPIS